MDLIIYNANIVTEEKTISGFIGIENGKFAVIGEGRPEMDAKEMEDAGGNYILPGAIDTHPHFFDPGAEWREDFRHGTRAAASGGFTTVLDMPNTTPPVKDRKTFELKMQRAKENSLIDFAFWGSAMPDNIHEFEVLKELGCIAFKAFTIDAGPDFMWSDEYDQFREMEKLAELGCIYGAHAENPGMVKRFSEKNISREWSLEVHDAERPWQAELTAIHTLLLYAGCTGCRLHICHMSIPEGARLIAEAKMKGIDVTAETCSHYLTLNYEDHAEYGTFARINPPLRSRERMNRLWEFVLDGTIDYLGTDHAPYLEEEKLSGDGNLRNAMCGAPEIDIAIPLLLDEGVKRRNMSLQRFAAFTAANAAKRFGLYPKKGAIMVGSDADFYIADLNAGWICSRKNTFSKSKVCKFAHEGKTLSSRIVSTYLRGNVIFENGRIKKEPGYGRYISV